MAPEPENLVLPLLRAEAAADLLTLRKRPSEQMAGPRRFVKFMDRRPSGARR
jgi:hypothetical protein